MEGGGRVIWFAPLTRIAHENQYVTHPQKFMNHDISNGQKYLPKKYLFQA